MVGGKGDGEWLLREGLRMVRIRMVVEGTQMENRLSGRPQRRIEGRREWLLREGVRMVVEGRETELLREGP